VVEYLLSHGWQQVDHPNEKMLVFDGLPDDEGTAIRVCLTASAIIIVGSTKLLKLLHAWKIERLLP
jgi:hypothetical protein